MQISTVTESAAGATDVNRLLEEYEHTVNRRGSNVFSRLRQNIDARSCWWNDQHASGRKQGKNAFPWENAADTRPHLVDMMVNEDKAVLMLAWQRARVLAQPREANDTSTAALLTNYVRWQTGSQMTEMDREVELLADWMLERGASVAGVFWKRELQNGLKRVDLRTLEENARRAMQVLGNPQMARQLSDRDLMVQQSIIELPTAIKNAGEEDRVAGVARNFLPHLTPSRLRKVVRDLREQGVAEFPEPYLRHNRPCLTAFEPNVDLFIPAEEVSPEDARAWYRRELLTESRLRERAKSLGWRRDLVNRVIETQRGRLDEDWTNRNVARRAPLQVADDESKVFQVVHAYRRLYDSDGVPGIFYTVFHRGMTQAPLWHGRLGYDHGEYPFTVFQREYRARHMDASRGYGEIAGTWQDGVKQELDLRRDRASVSTLPPTYYPPGMKPSEWGPGVNVPTDRPQDFGYFDQPRMDRGSEEVQEQLEMLAGRYTGRKVNEAYQLEADAQRQNMVSKWLTCHGKVNTQIIQLAQQFERPEIHFRVVGSAKGQPIQARREDIQGQFDVTVSMDVRSFLDTDYAKEMQKTLQAALEIDTEARVDRAEVIALLFESIDPNLADRLIAPGEEKAAQEIEAERQAIANIVAGVPTDVREGQNHALRLQVLEATIRGSERLKGLMEQDEALRNDMETHFKQLQKLHFDHGGAAAKFGRLGAQFGGTQGQ